MQDGCEGRALGAQTMTGPRRAEELAEELTSPGRTRPTVVVTMARGTSWPYIDADRLATELEDLCDVYLIADPAASWAFSRSMPELTQVYGGAGRVYPVELDWVNDPRRSRLRFAYSEAEGGSATGQLLEDGLRAAAAAGLPAMPRASSGHSSARELSGVVGGCPNPSQAMVTLSDGRYATIQVGLLCPAVAADRLFERGMEVRGLYDERSRRLDVSGMLSPPGERLSEAVDGEILLGRVESVGEASCEIALLPGATASVPRARVTDQIGDDLRDLLSVGEIVPVRVGSGGASLSIVDVEDDAQVRSLSVLPGGPGWLVHESSAVPAPPVQAVIPRPRSEADSLAAARLAADSPGAGTQTHSRPVPGRRPGAASYLDKRGQDEAVDLGVLRGPLRPGPGSPAPRPSPAVLAGRAVQVLERPVRRETGHTERQALEETRSTLRSTLLEKARLEQELRSSTLELQHLEAELARKQGILESRERELERLRRRNRKGAQREHRIAVSSDDLFVDQEEGFRFDVLHCWARRIPAGEKAERPLVVYRLGPQFLTSLADTPGVDRGKVLDVVVEVLTGLAGMSAGRQMHVLRTGVGGNEQPVRRNDGALCYRVALQRNAPQARRLHFWRQGEVVELSRVVLHDDYEP